MEHEDDDRRGKRKMVESRDKDSPCHGCGRLVAASSGVALRGHGDRRRHEQYMKDDEKLEMTGRTMDAYPNTPLHLIEFNRSYIREVDGEMLMRVPDDSHQHPIIDYSKSWKLVKEVR